MHISFLKIDLDNHVAAAALRAPREYITSLRCLQLVTFIGVNLEELGVATPRFCDVDRERVSENTIAYFAQKVH